MKISEVRYEDIHGSSATKVAVKLDCSKSEPCTGISLEKIALNYQDKPAAASCFNAAGNDNGLAFTSSTCLN